MKKYHKQILIIYGQNDNIVAHALQPAEQLSFRRAVIFG